MLSRLHAVQSDYDKELKFIHLKHYILFSSNGVFICILFNFMKMEMNSLAHPVMALSHSRGSWTRASHFHTPIKGSYLLAC